MYPTIKLLPAFVVVLIFCGWLDRPVCGQSTKATPAQTATPSASPQETARRAILDSDRWRRTQREFNEWLSIQTLYDSDEVATIKADLRERISRMSPRELEDFMEDMESRLRVLMSSEAEDARQWLAQFMAVAVNPERQLGRSRPDVLNMTASQIRQELAWLQQTREQRLRSQATFDQTRSIQTQRARDARARQQEARALPQDRSSWPANNPRRPSQYAPRADLQPQPLPGYIVSPWGHPIFWDR
jgi:hypothetical protein